MHFVLWQNPKMAWPAVCQQNNPHPIESPKKLAESLKLESFVNASVVGNKTPGHDSRNHMWVIWRCFAQFSLGSQVDFGKNMQKHTFYMTWCAERLGALNHTWWCLKSMLYAFWIRVAHCIRYRRYQPSDGSETSKCFELNFWCDWNSWHKCNVLS